MNILSKEKIAEIRAINRKKEIEAIIKSNMKLMMCESVDELEQDCKTILSLIKEYKENS